MPCSADVGAVLALSHLFVEQENFACYRVGDCRPWPQVIDLADAAAITAAAFFWPVIAIAAAEAEAEI